MNSYHYITGNLINAYYICKRKLWFFAHQINPTSSYDNLLIGKLISETSYKRGKKEISFGNIKIDMIKNENGMILVSEIKKSSKGLKAAEMQLLFYLLQLKKENIEAEGELLIPKERKKYKIQLTEEKEKELTESISQIKYIISKEKPPQISKQKRFCNKCAFFEFCWS